MPLLSFNVRPVSFIIIFDASTIRLEATKTSLSSFAAKEITLVVPSNGPSNAVTDVWYLYQPSNFKDEKILK